MKYNPNEIEAKWQKFWKENQTFKTDNKSDKPKYYVLDMFPYPSGAGLHVGHPLGYIASDIFARYKRQRGFNVLHPQGYDSFGLPAEQYAIQTGQHPSITTEENISRYREQLDRIGFSFDWSREVRTSNPDFYKHTQWIFVQLFNSWYNCESNKAESIDTLIAMFEKEGNKTVKAVCDDHIPFFTAAEWSSFSSEEQEAMLLKYRMTYLAETEVNWCPALGTVLANDEIKDGLSERGGHPVVRKKMKQWSMRISAYAERLLEGLDQIDWTESLKESQRNWIGKSVGASVTFNVKDADHTIEVFTTRPDTIFGVSFMTLAPEHDLVLKITTPEQKAAVEAYIEATSKRSERDRMADVKTISGVFTGAYAQHPFTKEPIEIWIGDYVLAGYGTGAVMAVPAGDTRDYAFAKHFGIEIKNIFDKDISEEAFAEKDGFVLENSDFLNGLDYKAATAKVIERLEALGQGYGKTNYRLRDAVFSRQRYWGEPFPVYYVNGLPKMIDSKYFPIVLPEVEKYLPTEDGQPPLGNASVWAWDTVNNVIVDNSLIDEKTVFALELNTMPGWAGSSWYWMRYMDPTNEEVFASKEALDYWQNVDLYIGGSEHATGHLLYSRFWNKFLKDLNYAPTEEPFQKLINQGMILGTSAFVYRIEGTNTFVSKDMIQGEKVQKLYAYVGLVNASSELDTEAFKAWRPDYANAEFVLNGNGKYIVGHEVEKMSKSYFNVVNPDDICEEYGADTLRLYEMFLGPLEQAKPWNTAGISGVAGFLKKLWRLYADDNGVVITDQEPTAEMYKSLHKTIKKVIEDIENFSFNTSVSQFMICVNELSQQKCHHRAILEPLAIVISPYAPHIAEELWSMLGNSTSVALADFPEFKQEYLVESSKEYPVSFNGKMRFKIELPLDLNEDQIKEIVMSDERTQAQLQGREPKKVIIVPGKIINLVG
ncbi:MULTISPECIES: leucine--tRNA ligase [Myroides]|uniref:Leucine--tRNA ligase n=1 Tax=Myroides albus TaxID=2562892 RepID=A0A6I3LLJ9_9FLAO|nr:MULTISPECIES: leucine--tRNA ligase [Myroides]MTG96855.1 leucine--tRNA ligase [Myroides albus]MVX36960.1 leucine--tRNA ligase [Myroides sp. LoEW2-1]UVD78395.1 leucine--tRNA ligase [Myroides albus]